ncbi:MAG: hypothetical protein C4325_14030 [Blastocatellia bacterium]
MPDCGANLLVKNNIPARKEIVNEIDSASRVATGTLLEQDQLKAALPRIIAHRGASAAAPENTIAAFAEAVRVSADGIEMDVRLAADGVPVVIHDSTLNRTGQIGGKIRQLTSSELARCDVGKWFRVKANRQNCRTFDGEVVPTLNGALKFLKDYRGLIYLELKCRDSELTRLVRAVCELVCDLEQKENIIIKSFRFAAIPLVKAICPEIRTAALFAPQISNIFRKDKHLVRLANEIGAEEVSIHYTLATRKLLKNAARRGLPVTIWTTDSGRILNRAIRLGITGIITNDPEKMIARRNAALSSARC